MFLNGSLFVAVCIYVSAMSGCESENFADTQNSATNRRTSPLLGLDLSTASSSTTTPPIVKTEPDSPSNGVKIIETTTTANTEDEPSTSNITITALVKTEPDSACIETVQVKVESPCVSPGERTGCVANDTPQITMGDGLGSGQQCSGGLSFGTSQTTTTKCSDYTFSSPLSGETLWKQLPTGELHTGTPQTTTAVCSDLRSSTCSAAGFNSFFGPAFGTPQTNTTSGVTFASRVFCGGFEQRPPAVKLQYLSCNSPQASTVCTTCGNLRFFNHSKSGCLHPCSRWNASPTFGSTPQHTAASSSTSFSFCNSGQQSSVFGTQPQTTVTTTASSPSATTASSPSCDVFLNNLQHMKTVWGKRLFPNGVRGVSSGSATSHTFASSPQTVCSVSSTPQTKLCFGVPGMKLPSTATQTASQQTPATGSPTHSSATTPSHDVDNSRLYNSYRRKRKYYSGYNPRNVSKYRREAPERYHAEDGYSRRDTAAAAHETGEDGTSRSERPLNFTASDVKFVIIPVDYPDVRLSEDDCTTLELALIEKLFSSKDTLLPQFSKCYHEGGALVLACETDNTKDWLEVTLPNLDSWKGAKLKVGNYKDYLYRTRISLRAPPSMTARNPKSILHLIKKQNKDLDTDQWSLLETLEKQNGQFLYLSLDPIAVQALKKRGYKLFLGLGQTSVNICDR